MQAFLVLAKSDKGECIIASADGKVLDMIQMLQLAQQHFTNVLIQQSIKQEKVKEDSDARPPADDRP